MKKNNIKQTIKKESIIDSPFIDALKEIQKIAGTPESQKMLDDLIAKRSHPQEKNGLSDIQKRKTHDFLKNECNADEYVCIIMTEVEDGLQTEVLTQLPNHITLQVLKQIVKSMEGNEGVHEELDID